MSKVHIHARMPDNLLLKDVYGAQMQIGSHGKATATFTEATADGGDQVVFTGKDFSYDGNTLVAGEVQQVSFLDASGKAYATFRILHFNVSQLPDPTSSSGFDAGAFTRLAYRDADQVNGSIGDDFIYALGGDDLIFAGKGADWINGGRGNDTLTGGADSDFFESGNGGGDDVITDFDATGGSGKQDVVSLDASSWTARKSGHDVVIEFGHGDSITLLDVHRSQISDADVFLTFEG